MTTKSCIRFVRYLWNVSVVCSISHIYNMRQTRVSGSCESSDQDEKYAKNADNFWCFILMRLSKQIRELWTGQNIYQS